jgi:DNA replication protein DnaC
MKVEKRNCDKHGEFEAKSRLVNGRWMQTVRSCPTCQKLEEEAEQIEADMRKALMLEKNKKSSVEKLLRQAGIPKRFKDCSFENYKTSQSSLKNAKLCKEYAEGFLENLENGTSRVFYGNVGTGKTHLACAIANEVMKKHQKSVLFTRAMRMLMDFKGTYSKTSRQSERDIVDRYASPDLLIIDEVGVHYGTDAEKVIFFEILDERYVNLKPTILITNQNIEGLNEAVGDRIVDRMNENGGGAMLFDWESYRK